MILLDLKMPGMDGHEVLAMIKTDPHFRHIPVIILTSSRLEEDILRAYDIGANSYLPKPGDALGYSNIATELHRFWVETAILPPERPK
jgi:CheY-like chemotaxis protein